MSDFETITDSSVYLEYKKLHHSITPDLTRISAIFNHVKPEISKVQDDISYISKTIQKDISDENRQSDLLDKKLNDSIKRLKRLYSGSLILRRKNEKYNYNSKKVHIISTKIEDVEQKVLQITGSLDKIVKALVEINDEFPEQDKFLTMNAFNERHYPILFDLLNKNLPESSHKKELQNQQSTALVNVSEMIPVAPNPIQESPIASLQEESAGDIESSVVKDMLKNEKHNINNSGHSNDNRNDGLDMNRELQNKSSLNSSIISGHPDVRPVLIPSFLKVKSAPSICQTTTNINAVQDFNLNISKLRR